MGKEDVEQNPVIENPDFMVGDIPSEATQTQDDEADDPAEEYESDDQWNNDYDEAANREDDAEDE